MKKKILKIVIVVIAIMLMYFIFFYVKPQGSFESIVNIKLEQVDKIDVSCGTSGSKKIITDKDEIKEFVSMFKDIELKKHSNQKQGDGFIFNVFFYSGNKKVASFDFGYDVITI